MKSRVILAVGLPCLIICFILVLTCSASGPIPLYDYVITLNGGESRTVGDVTVDCVTGSLRLYIKILVPNTEKLVRVDTNADATQGEVSSTSGLWGGKLNVANDDCVMSLYCTADQATIYRTHLIAASSVTNRRR